MRDIKAAYRQAMVEEYEAYRRAGRDAEAEHVADVLRERYGHEVAPEADAPERADAERPPENTAKPKPARTPAKRPAAKKAAGE